MLLMLIGGGGATEKKYESDTKEEIMLRNVEEISVFMQEKKR